MSSTPNYVYLDGQKIVATDNGDGTKTLAVSGGGGGGSSLSDIVFSDSSGQIFAYRDTGTGTPSAFALPAWTTYTPVAPITSVQQQVLQTTGNITTSGNVQINCIGMGTVAFRVSGTWVGSIVIEASIDGTNWDTTSYVSLATGNSATTFSANTTGQINCAGFDAIRLRGATLSSGTANVSMTAASVISNVMLDNPLPAGSNTIGKVQPTNSSGVVLDGLPTALGQKAMSACVPVVIASDQSIINTKDQNGLSAVRYTTDTTAVTGTTFAQIMCLTTTTFSVLTRTNATGSLTGVALPAGTLLVGPFTAYTLSSGAVAAYE